MGRSREVAEYTVLPSVLWVFFLYFLDSTESYMAMKSYHFSSFLCFVWLIGGLFCLRICSSLFNSNNLAIGGICILY